MYLLQAVTKSGLKLSGVLCIKVDVGSSLSGADWPYLVPLQRIGLPVHCWPSGVEKCYRLELLIQSWIC
jgi:hypothetical protein